MSYQSKHYSSDDVRRLQELVKEGVIVKQEVTALNEGLNETVKAIADEMEIPASQLKKVITTAFKNSRDDDADKFAELEDLLDSIGIK
jgi:hypothetical protein